jgi:hypothetical protein
MYTLAGRCGVWGVNYSLEDVRHWIGLLQYNSSTGGTNKKGVAGSRLMMWLSVYDMLYILSSLLIFSLPSLFLG